jgi:pterin-4a-carbinolamine dehydratase
MSDAATHKCPPVPPIVTARYSRQIERTFWFANFREALTFVQRVGELAESERHHPDIAFGWGHATVSLQTKKIKGLHENDFIMAVKIDRIAAERRHASNKQESNATADEQAGGDLAPARLCLAWPHLRA